MQVSWWVAAITHIWEYEPGNMKNCDKFWIDGGREWTGISAVMVVVHSEIMALDEQKGGKINKQRINKLFPEHN